MIKRGSTSQRRVDYRHDRFLSYCFTYKQQWKERETETEREREALVVSNCSRKFDNLP